MHDLFSYEGINILQIKQAFSKQVFKISIKNYSFLHYFNQCQITPFKKLQFKVFHSKFLD